ncbi:uncharacterized protein LOC132840004 isoform X1 [Tachysurus vachellii]|uniref:uncharacterized protein LOC132840004 isoform X1 n=1 Tax=Tachysurus vachellii TaxID=175792 RepID=UPI00296AD65B|nr:uncharacterized protein LOC132840004 isoform X1 [Tachysurus vachellii]
MKDELRFFSPLFLIRLLVIRLGNLEIFRSVDDDDDDDDDQCWMRTCASLKTQRETFQVSPHLDAATAGAGIGKQGSLAVMRERGMAMFWRFLSALSFDCLKGTPASSQRSSMKLGSSQPSSMESSSLTGSFSPGSDLQPHCQCCISYAAHLRRLSCGHLYCEPCTVRIVNMAFEDIEGLSEYPCPVCKSLRHLNGFDYSPTGSQRRLIEDKDEQRN